VVACHNLPVVDNGFTFDLSTPLQNWVCNSWKVFMLYVVLMHLAISPLQDYQALIEQLPEDDKPSYFNLPANIERSAQRVNSQRVISQLKALMRSVEAGAKFDRSVNSSKVMLPFTAIASLLTMSHCAGNQAQITNTCVHTNRVFFPRSFFAQTFRSFV